MEQTTVIPNLNVILDSLNISYLLFDLHYTLLDANNTFLKLSDSSREKIIGLDIRKFLSETEQEQIKKSMKGLRQGREYFKYEFFFFNSKRKIKIPCIFQTSINKDKNGKPISINVLVIDIMEQKGIQRELEKEKKTLEAILFGIRDCVSIFDTNGNYVFGNASSKRIHTNDMSPMLPLDLNQSKEFNISINGKQHRFKGEVRAIDDNEGNHFAYAETLTDITDAVELEESKKELFFIRRKVKLEELKTKMIGNSRAMMPVFKMIQRCAEVDSSVLITGETGVGKELAARAVHEQSHRSEKPFVAVNCSALPETLLESELFGHTKGAFTGAISNRLGLFREADGGTLFLDEIGDLNKSLQVKLLRVLQEKEVRPVGGDKTYSVDVRIISATNRNLEELAGQKIFRRDLYYRIAVIPLHMPPLRDRPDDIVRLANYFISKYQRTNRQYLKSLNEDCVRIFCEYHWPGNIRELENAIEYALAMSRSPTLTPKCLPRSIKNNELILNPEALSVQPQLEKIEVTKNMSKKQELIEILSQYNGNQTHAAKALGISRTTLWRRIKKYQISL